MSDVVVVLADRMFTFHVQAHGLAGPSRMIDQKAFDDVADSLVEAGTRVTYESLREAFRERNRTATGDEHGTSHSPRDLQDPFNSWKRRRRYKPYLALHDIPEEAEKALAASLDAVRKAAGRLPIDVPPFGPMPATAEVLAQVERMKADLLGRLDGLAAENAGLRRDLAALPLQRGAKVIRKGRKSGVFDSTSRHFWNQLMLVFKAHIKKEGPKSLAELFPLIDRDTHDLAAAAFEAIDDALLKEKLAIRVDAENYFKLENGFYHLLPPEPKKRKPKASPQARAKARPEPKRPVSDKG